MEKFSFTVSAVFSSDKSITFELIPEAVDFLRANGCLAEGKTRGGGHDGRWENDGNSPLCTRGEWHEDGGGGRDGGARGVSEGI